MLTQCSMLRHAQASYDLCKTTVKIQPKPPQGAKVYEKTVLLATLARSWTSRIPWKISVFLHSFVSAHWNGADFTDATRSPGCFCSCICQKLLNLSRLSQLSSHAWRFGGRTTISAWPWNAMSRPSAKTVIVMLQPWVLVWFLRDVASQRLSLGTDQCGQRCAFHDSDWEHDKITWNCHFATCFFEICEI